MYFRNRILNDGVLRPTDVELVRAVRGGEKWAFVEIVARHQTMVCGIALGILSDFSASEDVAQDAFLTAWTKFYELREPERLRGWLAQIARNAALTYRRRQRGHDVLENEPGLIDTSLRPDEVAEKEDEAALVRETLAKLPENYRLPLVLYYRESQSVQAVAQVLEISEDAVRQRLARGREMLRDKMSGLIETVLTRTGLTPVFTMAIAAAIGALATPAAVAGTVFAASAATSSTSAASSTLTAMTTSKTFLVTALVTALCVPIGYQVAGGKPLRNSANVAEPLKAPAPSAKTNPTPSVEESALFAEWRQLHETYGTSADAMPNLYRAIADIKDPYRRRAFHAALIAEWAQVDPTNGLAFFLEKGRDNTQRREFFAEWLNRDAAGAVDALMASPSGWEKLANDCLLEIARQAPSRIAAIVPSLPKAQNDFWDSNVREAFAIVAEKGLASARTAAEALPLPHRIQALTGVAQTWGKSDLNAALAWVNSLPEALHHDGNQRDEIIRGALLGKAAVDPGIALEHIGIVPPGGKAGYFASTTGARVLKEAAKNDFDTTVAWIAAHPGRLGYEDMMGITEVVTDRLNADPIGFLNHHASDKTLGQILPAIGNALINESGGQRAVIWEWLKTQLESEVSIHLKEQVMRSAAWQDPELMMQWAADLPQTPEGDAQTKKLAIDLLNGGAEHLRLEGLIEKAPERIRQPLIEYAFNTLSGNTLSDPQVWVARFAQLPDNARGQAAAGLARAWASQTPEEAVGWVNSLPAGVTRNEAVAAAITSWAAKDAHGAAHWTATLPTGAEYDRGAAAMAQAIAERNPGGALEWVMSISDATEQQRIAAQTAKTLATRNSALAQQWIEATPFTPDVKAQLQLSLEKGRMRQTHILPP